MVKVSAATSSASARVGVRRIAYARTCRWCSVKSALKRARDAVVGRLVVTVPGRPRGRRGSRQRPSAHGLVQAGPERHLPPAAGPRGLESITSGRRRDEVASVLVPVAVLTVGRRWIQQEDGLL